MHSHSTICFVTLDGNRIIDVPSITSVFDGSLSEETFAGFLKVSQMKFFPENIKDGSKVHALLLELGYERPRDGHQSRHGLEFKNRTHGVDAL